MDLGRPWLADTFGTPPLCDLGFKAMAPLAPELPEESVENSLENFDSERSDSETSDQSLRGLCASVALRSLVLGQVISIMNTLTGIFSATLADDGISIPTIQSSLNYFLLAPLLLLAYPKIRAEGLRLPWWRYALWALADVEGNYLVVTAYRYTSVASVMLLDGFTGPAVMLLSRLLLGTRYIVGHIVACVVCLCGLSLTVFADSAQRESAPTAWSGDLLVILGTLCYAASNVQQEFLLKNHCSRYEALGMLGLCGSVISCVQAISLEGHIFVEIDWAWKDVACLLGFQACLFGVYMLVSIFLQISDAAVFNMSLLTCDVYSILFSWQAPGREGQHNYTCTSKYIVIAKHLPNR